MCAATLHALQPACNALPTFVPVQDTLLAKFNAEMLDLSDLNTTYARDGFEVVDRMLQSISPVVGVRTKIINALTVST